MRLPILLVRLNGVSMSPTLDDGDFVLVVRLGRAAPRVGQVLVADVPALGRVVKRVVARDAQGWLALAGDNQLSIAPEHLGRVSPSTIAGRVWLRVGRRGGVTGRGLSRSP
ncbi:MAG: S24/S26 family peptidase [Polyangiales bacterium]